MCVSSRTAQAEEPSEQGEGGDDEDQASFVCPFGVCSDFASKAARKDVEEQAASARTADPVEDAPKASERAVGLRFCSLKIPLQTVAFAPAGAGRAAAANSSGERGSGQNRKQMCSANTAAKARESTPALGRIWTNESEDWPSMSWKRHRRRL